MRSQDRVGNDASAGLALYQSHTTYPVWAATRGAGARGRTESALGHLLEADEIMAEPLIGFGLTNSTSLRGRP